MRTAMRRADADPSVRRLIGQLTLCYALFASAWIVLSDKLLALFVNAGLMTRIGMAKGLTFVAVTSLLLHLALGVVARRSREDALPGDGAGLPQGAPLAPTAALVLAALSTAAAFALRASLDIPVHERPMLIVFMAPITLTALFGGFAAGLFATALTVLGQCALAFGVDHFSSAAVRDLFVFQLLVLCGNGVAVSLASAALHRAHAATRRALQRECAIRDEYRVLSDQMPDPMWRKDLSGRYLDCNERFAAVVGVPREEILGRSDAELLDAAAAARFASQERAVIETRAPADQEERWEAPLALGWVHVQRAPVLDAAGTCVGTLGIARDINRRHLAERALKHSEALFRTLFDIGEDAVLIATLDGAGTPRAVTHCNATAGQMFGYPAAELLELGPAALLDEADVERFDAALATAAADGRAHLGATGVHRGGRRLPLEITLIRFELGESGRQAMLIALRDISARVEAAAEQARLNQQVTQMQKLEAIGQLTGGIAHDFNNILATIVGFNELAVRNLDDVSPTRAREHLAQVAAAAQRGRELVAKMMAFGRTHAMPDAPAAAPYPAVQEAVALLRSAIPASIEITSELSPTAGMVACEAVEIEQLVMNLAINARDAIVGPGRISVTLRGARLPRTVCAACLADFAGDHVEIAVADTGRGIAAVDLPRVFQPFYTTKEVGKGTGLGLAMVHGIVHRAGGHVQVDSKPGEGTTFRLWLPVTATAAAAPRGTCTAPGPATSGSGRHVLVIDDEAPLGRYWREVLEGEGYRVSTFADSREARESFTAAPGDVDAVLCDLHMPQMPGDQLAAELLAQRPDLPVFLMSGNADPVVLETLVERGVRGCFQKPVDSATVLQALRAALA